MADDVIGAAGLGVSDAEYLRRVDEISDLLKSQSADANTQGELTDEVITAMQDRGLLNMAAPRRLGGASASATLLAETSAGLARACPSAAWVASIYNSVIWLASTTPQSMRDIVFKDGTPNMCSPQNGMGMIEEVDGKFIVNGRWAYATGSHHAEYALVPALLNKAEPRLILLPMSDVELSPTWKVTGMKATGSDTVVAENVELTADQMAPMVGVAGDHALDDFEKESCDYWVPFPILRAKSLGVLVGCAEGLLDEIKGSLNKPLIYSTFERRGDSAVFHSEVGSAASKIRAARQLMLLSTQQVDDAAAEKRGMSIDERVQLRADAAVVVQLLSDAIEKMMNLMGSGGFSEFNPTSRYWRDFSIASRHIIFNESLAHEAFGRYTLDLPIEILQDDFV